MPQLRVNNAALIGLMQKIAVGEIRSRTALSVIPTGPKILVTGGAGFIGSNLCLVLKKDGFDVHATYRGDPQRLLQKNRVMELAGIPEPNRYQVDLTDLSAVKSVVSRVRPDVVVHTDLFKAVRAAEQDPVTCRNFNIKGTCHLLQAMQESGVRNMVLSSTGDAFQPPLAHSSVEIAQYPGIREFAGQHAPKYNFVENNFPAATLSVTGVMTEREKAELLACLGKVDPGHPGAAAIEKLYKTAYQNSLISENSPLNTSNVAGASLAVLDRIIKERQRFPDVRMISLHSFNLCGAPPNSILRECPSKVENTLVPTVLEAALYQLASRFGLELPGYSGAELVSKLASREIVRVYGSNHPDSDDGTCVRDFIGISFLNFFLQSAIEKILAPDYSQRFASYILGSIQGHSVIQVINLAENVVRKVVGLPGIETSRLFTLDGQSPERVIPFCFVPENPGEASFMVGNAQAAIEDFVASPVNPNRQFKGEGTFDWNLQLAFQSILYRPERFEFPPAVPADHPVHQFYK